MGLGATAGRAHRLGNQGGTYARHRRTGWQTLLHIELDRRRNYSAATIARLENVYRLKSGSIPRTLAGGPLETLDLVHGEPRPAVGTDDDHRDELRRAGLLADTAAALTGPAERQIRAEISMRGKRANAAALFNDRVERAMWRKLEFPEDVRVRQIAAYRLLCEAAESARKLARGTRAKPARRPARSTGNPPELAPWTSPSFAT